MESRFNAIASLLEHFRPIWSERPFYTAAPLWRHWHPALADWLLSLPDAELNQLETDTGALINALRFYLPELASLAELAELPPLPAKTPATVAERLGIAVGGRKWEQVKAFATALHRPEEPILEWCAGKGHLGRVLSSTWQLPVKAVEQRSDLCARGAKLAIRDGAGVKFVCRDVMTMTPPELATYGAVVALHACGDLHTTLLRNAAAGRTTEIALAPCCYHLTTGGQRPWLSQAAQRHGPPLDREDLRLIPMETVVASLRAVRRRDRLNRWRLGFDELQRTTRGVSTYLPVPPVPATLADGDFASFCRHCAVTKGVRLPDRPDFAHFEARGHTRFERTRRLSLVRHPFRRPLEVALLLDYALYLDEHGYDCRTGTFCDKSLTPRNLCLIGQRRQAGR